MGRADLVSGRLGRFVWAGLISYVVASVFVSAPTLILVLNDLLMAAAIGVCVAYAPVVPAAVSARSPSKGEYLILGIWLVSLCMLQLRVVSIVARDFNHPEIYNSPVIPFALVCGFMGAMLHLWAATIAADGRPSRKPWAVTAAVVAVGAFISLASWSLHLNMTQPTPFQLR